MAQLATNNAYALLPNAVSSNATSITIETGKGALFPVVGNDDYFYATLVDVSGNYEIVKATARVGDVLTVVRAQQNTAALAFPANSRIELRVTAVSIDTGTISVKSYGAKGDGIADDTIAIQAAINAAAASYRTIIVPAGTYKITSTIYIPHSNVRLAGEGFIKDPYSVSAGSFIDAVGTVFSWAGAANGTMLHVGWVNGTSLRKVVGVSIDGIAFNGMGIAGVGLYILSSNSGIYTNICIENCVGSAALYMTTTTYTIPYSASPNNQENYFCNIIIEVSGSTNGIYLGSDIAVSTAGLGNTSCNTFINTVIRFAGTRTTVASSILASSAGSGATSIVVAGPSGIAAGQNVVGTNIPPGAIVTADYVPGSTTVPITPPTSGLINSGESVTFNNIVGDAVVFEACDSNTFYHLRCIRLTSNYGYAIRFIGAKANVTGYARTNYIYHLLSSQGGILALTGDGSNPSDDNAVFGSNMDGGSVNIPVVVDKGVTSSVTGARFSIENSRISSRQTLQNLIAFSQDGTYQNANNSAASALIYFQGLASRAAGNFYTGNGKVFRLYNASATNAWTLDLTSTGPYWTGDAGPYSAPSFASKVEVVTGTPKTLDTQSSIILIDASGGNRIINLPLAASYPNVRSPRITIRRIDSSANTVTVRVQLSSIDKLNGGVAGSSSETLAVGQGKTYVCDYTDDWYSF